MEKLKQNCCPGILKSLARWTYGKVETKTVAAAFEKVWHDGLMEKLKQNVAAAFEKVWHDRLMEKLKQNVAAAFEKV